MRSPRVGLVLLATTLFLTACGGSSDEPGTSAVQGPPQQQNPPPQNPPPQNPPPQNDAPTIAGNPPSQATVGQPYSFTPQASDPDGDSLTFTIENKPDWADFDSSNGRLSGTPDAGDVGTTSNIVIRVSDGTLTASLNAFSVTVNDVPAPTTGSATLSWNAPTERTDGSPLTNLAGYRIYYGNSPGNYTASVSVNNPSITTYVIENLSAGTYYFVVTALDSAGAESSFSNVASKTVG